MTNVRLWETARKAFFCASPRHSDFLAYETETSKCFERERETFTHRAPNLVESYANELECAYIEAL